MRCLDLSSDRVMSRLLVLLMFAFVICTSAYFTFLPATVERYPPNTGITQVAKPYYQDFVKSEAHFFSVGTNQGLESVILDRRKAPVEGCTCALTLKPAQTTTCRNMNPYAPNTTHTAAAATTTTTTTTASTTTRAAGQFPPPLHLLYIACCYNVNSGAQICLIDIEEASGGSCPPLSKLMLCKKGIRSLLIRDNLQASDGTARWTISQDVRMEWVVHTDCIDRNSGNERDYENPGEEATPLLLDIDDFAFVFPATPPMSLHAVVGCDCGDDAFMSHPTSPPPADRNGVAASYPGDISQHAITQALGTEVCVHVNNHDPFGEEAGHRKCVQSSEKIENHRAVLINGTVLFQCQLFPTNSTAGDASNVTLPDTIYQLSVSKQPQSRSVWIYGNANDTVQTCVEARVSVDGETTKAENLVVQIGAYRLGRTDNITQEVLSQDILSLYQQGLLKLYSEGFSIFFGESDTYRNDMEFFFSVWMHGNYDNIVQAPLEKFETESVQVKRGGGFLVQQVTNDDGLACFNTAFTSGPGSSSYVLLAYMVSNMPARELASGSSNPVAAVTWVEVRSPLKSCKVFVLGEGPIPIDLSSFQAAVRFAVWVEWEPEFIEHMGGLQAANRVLLAASNDSSAAPPLTTQQLGPRGQFQLAVLTFDQFVSMGDDDDDGTGDGSASDNDTGGRMQNFSCVDGVVWDGPQGSVQLELFVLGKKAEIWQIPRPKISGNSTYSQVGDVCSVLVQQQTSLASGHERASFFSGVNPLPLTSNEQHVFVGTTLNISVGGTRYAAIHPLDSLSVWLSNNFLAVFALMWILAIPLMIANAMPAHHTWPSMVAWWLVCLVYFWGILSVMYYLMDSVCTPYDWVEFLVNLMIGGDLTPKGECRDVVPSYTMIVLLPGVLVGVLVALLLFRVIVRACVKERQSRNDEGMARSVIKLAVFLVALQRVLDRVVHASWLSPVRVFFTYLEGREAHEADTPRIPVMLLLTVAAYVFWLPSYYGWSQHRCELAHILLLVDLPCFVGIWVVVERSIDIQPQLHCYALALLIAQTLSCTLIHSWGFISSSSLSSSSSSSSSSPSPSPSLVVTRKSVALLLVSTVLGVSFNSLRSYSYFSFIFAGTMAMMTAEAFGLFGFHSARLAKTCEEAGIRISLDLATALIYIASAGLTMALGVISTLNLPLTIIISFLFLLLLLAGIHFYFRTIKLHLRRVLARIGSACKHRLRLFYLKLVHLDPSVWMPVLFVLMVFTLFAVVLTNSCTLTSCYGQRLWMVTIFAFMSISLPFYYMEHTLLAQAPHNRKLKNRLQHEQQRHSHPLNVGKRALEDDPHTNQFLRRQYTPARAHRRTPIKPCCPPGGDLCSKSSIRRDDDRGLGGGSPQASSRKTELNASSANDTTSSSQDPTMPFLSPISSLPSSSLPHFLPISLGYSASPPPPSPLPPPYAESEGKRQPQPQQQQLNQQLEASQGMGYARARLTAAELYVAARFDPALLVFNKNSGKYETPPIPLFCIRSRGDSVIKIWPSLFLGLFPYIYVTHENHLRDSSSGGGGGGGSGGNGDYFPDHHGFDSSYYYRLFGSNPNLSALEKSSQESKSNDAVVKYQALSTQRPTTTTTTSTSTTTTTTATTAFGKYKKQNSSKQKKRRPVIRLADEPISPHPQSFDMSKNHTNRFNAEKKYANVLLDLGFVRLEQHPLDYYYSPLMLLASLGAGAVIIVVCAILGVQLLHWIAYSLQSSFDNDEMLAVNFRYHPSPARYIMDGTMKAVGFHVAGYTLTWLQSTQGVPVTMITGIISERAVLLSMLAALNCSVLLLRLYNAYKRHILRLRRGEYWFNPQDVFSANGNIKMILLVMVNTIMLYWVTFWLALMIIVLVAVMYFIKFLRAHVFNPVVNYILYSLSLLFLIQYLSYLIGRKVFSIRGSEGFISRNLVYSFVAFLSFTMWWSIILELFLLKIIAWLTGAAALFDVQHPASPLSILQLLDSGYYAYYSTLLVDHHHNNPIVLAFCAQVMKRIVRQRGRDKQLAAQKMHSIAKIDGMRDDSYFHQHDVKSLLKEQGQQHGKEQHSRPESTISPRVSISITLEKKDDDSLIYDDSNGPTATRTSALSTSTNSSITGLAVSAFADSCGTLPRFKEEKSRNDTDDGNMVSRRFAAATFGRSINDGSELARKGHKKEDCTVGRLENNPVICHEETALKCPPINNCLISKTSPNAHYALMPSVEYDSEKQAHDDSNNVDGDFKQRNHHHICLYDSSGCRIEQTRRFMSNSVVSTPTRRRRTRFLSMDSATPGTVASTRVEGGAGGGQSVDAAARDYRNQQKKSLRIRFRLKWLLFMNSHPAIHSARKEFCRAKAHQAVDFTRSKLYELENSGRRRSKLSLKRMFLSTKELSEISFVLEEAGTALRRLDLSQNPLGPKAAPLIANIIKSCPIKHVDLSWTQLGDSGIRKLCRALLKEKTPNSTYNLQSLTLIGNGITDRGAHALLALRRELRTLRDIRLEQSSGYGEPIVGSTVSVKIQSSKGPLSKELKGAQKVHIPFQELSSSSSSPPSMFYSVLAEVLELTQDRVLVKPMMQMQKDQHYNYQGTNDSANEDCIKEQVSAFWTLRPNVKVRYNHVSDKILAKLHIFAAHSGSFRLSGDW